MSGQRTRAEILGVPAVPLYTEEELRGKDSEALQRCFREITEIGSTVHTRRVQMEERAASYEAQRRELDDQLRREFGVTSEEELVDKLHEALREMAQTYEEIRALGLDKAEPADGE